MSKCKKSNLVNLNLQKIIYIFTLCNLYIRFPIYTQDSPNSFLKLNKYRPLPAITKYSYCLSKIVSHNLTSHSRDAAKIGTLLHNLLIMASVHPQAVLVFGPQFPLIQGFSGNCVHGSSTNLTRFYFQLFWNKNRFYKD